MPFLTRPKGTPAPSAADFAGMPMEAVEGAMAPAAEGLWNTVKGAWQGIRPQLRGLSNLVGEPSSQAASPALAGLKSAVGGAGTAELAPAGNGLSTLPYGYSSARPPVPGGPVADVLSRGAELQGAGQDVPPGTARLLQHYARLIR